MYTKYYQDCSAKKHLRNLDIEGKLFKMNLNDTSCRHVEELMCFVVESKSPVFLVLCINGNFLTSLLYVSFPVTIFASYSQICHCSVEMGFVDIESSCFCIIIGNLPKELAYVFVE